MCEITFRVKVDDRAILVHKSLVRLWKSTNTTNTNDNKREIEKQIPRIIPYKPFLIHAFERKKNIKVHLLGGSTLNS